MAMVVKNNMSAVRTLNTLNTNSSALQKSLAKVSSGMKINSAQDDASGYAISERMRVQIRSLDQANQNTQNASSLMKTAEGAVGSTMEILKTLKEKAINAATDTNTDADRATIQKELDQYIDQIDDNALTTFNGKYLVDGSKSQQGVAVATAMTNQSLDKNTTADSKLVDLKNRNGESLEIADTDSITASYVMNGYTYTTKMDITSVTTLSDVLTKLNSVTASDSGSDTPASTNIGAESGLYKETLDKIVAGNQTVSKADLQTLTNTTLTAVAGVDTTVDPSLAKDVYDALETAALTTTTTGNGSAVSATLDQSNMFDNGKADAVVIGSTNVAAGSNGSAAGKANSDDVKSAIKGLVEDALTTASGKDTYDEVLSSLQSDLQNVTFKVNGYNADHSVDTTISVSDDTLKSYATAVIEKKAYDKATDGTTYDSILNSTDDATTEEVPEPGAGGGIKGITSSNTSIGTSVFGDPVTTADGTNGLTITAKYKGIAGQISGLTLSITDSEGNVKKSANAALDDFNTTIYAKNKSDANEMTFQVGASANQAITVGLDDMRSEALGLKGADGSKVSVATQDKANAAVAVFDNAIQKVLDQQATIGAIESRLEYTSQNLTTSSENVQAAESTIRDADMAKEMTTYTKNNVLLQAAQSMLAQANQNSSAVLSLLQ